MTEKTTETPRTAEQLQISSQSHEPAYEYGNRMARFSETMELELFVATRKRQQAEHELDRILAALADLQQRFDSTRRAGA